jgi:hypothetical protein
MNPDLHRELTPLLFRDYAFKEQKGMLRQGRCPECGKKELYTNAEAPWILRCGRLTNCGVQLHVKELYPHLFENWSERHKSTPENPHAAADAYLQSARGFNLDKIRGWYTQETFYSRELGISTATVRFALPAAGPDVFWERLIDQPQRFGSQKANFRGSYRGHCWVATGIDLVNAKEVWIVEGIFDAIAQLHAGNTAISAMSCNNYPELTLAALAQDCEAASKPRPTLVFALDGDKAGREYTLRHIAQAKKDGWKAIAITIPQGRHKRDWNDLWQNEQLTREAIEEYRYHGRLLTAESAQDKAVIIYNRKGWQSFHFDFDLKTFWFQYDHDRYAKAREPLDERQDMSDDEKRNMALTESQCCEEIATCAFAPLYFQQNKLTDESWYYFRIDMKGRPTFKNTFTGAQVAGAATFKQRLLSVAPGANFIGSSKQLDRIFKHQMDGIKTVDTVDFVGYSKENACYLFSDHAVSKGKVCRINDEDFFELGKLSIKTLNKSLRLEINDTQKDFTTTFIADMWTCWGAQGIVALAWWLGALFAEQIRGVQKSYPFIEIVGEPGTGKSTLIEFMWKLLGRLDYEGFDPEKASAAGRARNFSQVSNLPIVLIESDREGEDTNKQKRFDWDELKTAYNGRAIRATGVKNGGNDTYEPPFRGAVVISQNAEVAASEAVLQRIVQLMFTLNGQNKNSKEAAVRLERTPIESVSGFILRAVTQETEILRLMAEKIPEHEQMLASSKDIKLTRLIKNHAQIMALVDCLRLVIPLTDNQAYEAQNQLFIMAENRQQAISADHPAVQTFWETFDYLNGDSDSPDQQLNHSDEAGEIALNFNHFVQVAADKRQQVPEIKELKRLLKTGRTRKFIGIKSVRSGINNRYNASRHSDHPARPSIVHCWVFKQS